MGWGWDWGWGWVLVGGNGTVGNGLNLVGFEHPVGDERENPDLKIKWRRTEVSGGYTGGEWRL